jgi:hypothetical protein
MAAREAALMSELLEGDIAVDALKHKLLGPTLLPRSQPTTEKATRYRQLPVVMREVGERGTRDEIYEQAGGLFGLLQRR